VKGDKKYNIMEDKLYRAFSGSEIEAILLQGALEDNQISSIYRDGSTIGVSQFYGGTPLTIDLFINKADLGTATPIIEEFIRNQNSEKLNE